MLPNLRTALLSATVLTVALVLGEFTMASLDQYQTFPVWIVELRPDQRPGLGGGLAARAVRHLVFLLAIATLGTRRARQRGGAEVAAVLGGAAATCQATP